MDALLYPHLSCVSTFRRSLQYSDDSSSPSVTTHSLKYGFDLWFCVHRSCSFSDSTVRGAKVGVSFGVFRVRKFSLDFRRPGSLRSPRSPLWPLGSRLMCRADGKPTCYRPLATVALQFAKTERFLCKPHHFHIVNSGRSSSSSSSSLKASKTGSCQRSSSWLATINGDVTPFASNPCGAFA